MGASEAGKANPEERSKPVSKKVDGDIDGEEDGETLVGHVKEVLHLQVVRLHFRLDHVERKVDKDEKVDCVLNLSSLVGPPQRCEVPRQC